MWLKFAVIAALVFHRADAVNVVNAASDAHSAPQSLRLSHREQHRAVDYWLRGSAFKKIQSPKPINKEWKTEAGQHGSVLLGNVVAAQASPKSEKHPVPSGEPLDYTLIKHKAEGLKADHPANREYK
jgi:hypothetical protein